MTKKTDGKKKECFKKERQKRMEIRMDKYEKEYGGKKTKEKDILYY